MAWLRGIFITLLSLSSFNSLALAQESIRADHVKVSLVAPTQLEPGDNLFALRFEVDPHWHIYWKNPGDSGTAPRFAFDAKHAAVSDILWPVPKRILVGDFVNLGFEGEVLFPFTVRPGDTATSVEIKADLEWLVCEEECLPGEGVITFTRPVAEKAVWAGDDQKKLGDVMKALPMGSDVSPWSLKSMRMIEGNRVAFEVVHAEGNSIEGLTIFPEDGGVYKPKAPVISDDKKALILDVNANGKVPDVGSFLLVDERGAWTHKDFALTKSDVKMSEAGSLSTFLILLLSAFVGGIILNLMPCVLPVLSIKFFSLAKMNKETRWHEILYYTLGVLVTFTALGGIFLALRATGSAVGWGFQLQSPPIVLSLIMLFFLMGLSFLGFFEFGDAIVRSAGRFE
ncbi:MAG: glucan 1,4-alpha-glucosidase, partial [Proteobacteria bacterium]